MSMFDSIISEADGKYGLGNKAEALLAALLGLITDQNRGGLAGFLELFRNAGLRDSVSSWTSGAASSSLSGEQVESALGKDTVAGIANQTGVDASAASSALGFMIPPVVDRLTPDGEIPDEKSLLSRVGDFLSGTGVATAAGIGAATAFDRIGDASSEIYGAANKTVGTVNERTPNALNRVDEEIDNNNENSVLKWLIPLILLGLLIAAGAAFCRKSEAPPTTNANKANSNIVVVNNNSLPSAATNSNTNK